MKFIKYILAIIVLVLFSAAAFAACNNGILEGNEECDNGEDNSDTRPDACRTDCVWYYCGDGVIDSGEECDDGERPLYPSNDDRIPNQCREDCRLPWCGDGVVDYAYGEECDDALSEEGCHQCMQCYNPEDNLHISSDVKLCPGTYTIADDGEEGVIIVDGSDITVDCNGAKLIGVEPELAQQQQTQVGQQVQQISGQEDEEEDQGFVAQFFGFIANIFTGGGSPSGDTTDVTGHNSLTLKVGTGIYVKGDNVVLVGCDVKNYRHGVKLSSSSSENVLAANRLCSNNYDIKDESQDNFGAANLCDNAINWQENGVSGCTFDCSGSSNKEEVECPPCPDCPECPTCENVTEQQPEPQQEPEKTTEQPAEDEDCIKLYVNVGYTEYQAKMICAGEMKIDECLKKYIEAGYSKEEAKKMCEEPTKETTDTTSTEEDCIKKYVEAGYTKDEAVGICSGKIQLDDCIKKYIESGYSKEEAEKKCGLVIIGSPFVKG